MKTPIQELIEWLDKYGDNRLYGGRELTVHEIKNQARQMLEKEKETICNAFSDGRHGAVESRWTAEEYFEITFNTKEK